MASVSSILGEILEHKRAQEVPARKRSQPLAEVRAAAEAAAAAGPTRDFAAALNRPDGRVALIAEVKRASPSKGDLVKGEFDPVALGSTYAAHGASAISVLTDERYFKGALRYMTEVRVAVPVPVLRKDFVVDAYQVYEARMARADAVLLIVAALEDGELAELHALAGALGLAALVEVHDEAECERALKTGARLVGVNNRDLRTFQVDLETTGRCARVLRAADSELCIVSESGIFTPSHVAHVASLGARAILVGESIITSGDLPNQVRLLSSVPRRP